MGQYAVSQWGERNELPTSYTLARDDWLLANALELAIDAPQYSCQILHPKCGWIQNSQTATEWIAFEEFAKDGDPSGACLTQGEILVGFGSTSEVLGAVTDAETYGEWIDHCTAALERERAWTRDDRFGARWRRWALEVFPLTGQLYHITSCENRDSIRRHGLHWELMGAAHGIAGSRGYELPMIFLEGAEEGCEWWINMARVPVDVWAIDAGGLWGENGTDDGVMVAEPIESERLRLVATDKTSSRHRRQ